MKYLKTEEVSKITGIAEVTLMRWRAQKKGPPYVRLEGWMIRYPKDGLEKWLKEAENGTKE